MGTASFTREQLNDVIEQFANKIMESLGANAADEETSEPELTGTHFKATDTDGAEMEVDAAKVMPGTLVLDGSLEYFRCYADNEIGPWVKYTGISFTHDEFAEEMRLSPMTPCVVHRG